MFEWALSIKGEERWGKRTVVAPTASKAKYEHYVYMKEFWDVDFKEFFYWVQCRKVGPASIKSFFGDKEQFERICDRRGIQFAYQGMRIEVVGKMGTIVGGNNSCNLDVVFDGKWYAENVHPWWRTKYFDKDGALIKEYGD